ncbi:ras and Rab interactor 2-like isoform X2 [Periophthalmus magnuspinnatus]|uniref:ras and Rab interactor 2-like isoform X2 n=1 Tax=Periophthalmus magnuspinnatus TaxID=409849 RepID=UPI00145B4488|nr:ras and Rab interactor 2-like isoform X2 [Periophthalmus magnuspinnatus]
MADSPNTEETPSGLTDRSGSYFKLVDTFALELEELEKEMVKKEVDHETLDITGLDGDMSAVHLDPDHHGGTGGERDSGYDSLRRRMSVLDRLTQTHTVWLLLCLSEEEAGHILLQQPPGVFLVCKSPALQRKVLSVRLKEDQSENPISHFPVRESQYTFSLEGSAISFADLFRLVAFYCISRDVLPFTLKLPEAIASAKTQKELEEVAQLGPGFWDSVLCSLRGPAASPRTCRTCRPVSRTLSPPRPNKSRDQDATSPQRYNYSSDSAPPTLRSQNLSSFQEKRHSSGPLCYVNPLFLQTRHHHRSQDRQRESHGSERNPELSFSLNVDEQEAKLNNQSRSPPPRPPPPRSMPKRRPAPPPPAPATTKSTTRPKSMPVVHSNATPRKLQPSTKRPAPAPPTSTNKSSKSPSKSSKTPPPRPKKPDLESHRCHIALDDETIAKALSRAKIPTSPPTADKPLDDAEMSERNQHLSDVSMSTSSSDSLEYPRYTLRQDLASSPSQDQDIVEDSSDEDEEGEYEEEEDYGVGLEADLEMRLRPSFKSRRRRMAVRLSGGSLILPRALKGRFRKVSGMLSSLMTPERRAVKRIAELSRDKSSYFGSLVQDYLSFVQENKACHTSGIDFLQTLRQFLTQMKAYLKQSSELDPPLESLIPEDQIDQVLEKAMHKCVLKPLKSVIDVILHDFQVSSGGWQQLKENLALAKSKRPQELGVDGAAVPPDAVVIEKIRHKFVNMRKMYSPEKKVSLLLRICKLIYTIMQDNSGRMFGADDFLPMLTYVMAQCDMPQLDTDIQYMMELLDPSLLQGEGGYYLTSAYGAMSLIKNFQEEQAARVLSSETRNTLHQWHRRRTAQRTAPSVDDFQVSRLT